MKIWVTGSNGMLGRDLCSLAKDSHLDFVYSDLEVDITNRGCVMDFAREHRPNVVINCAAYTAVDSAETEKDINHRLNAVAPGILSECSAEIGANILHVSTDYVLNGCAPEPLREDSELSPLNEYGKAKALGERALADANVNHWIIRTSWLYGVYGKNFVKTMLNLMWDKERISVVDDQQGNPTWTVDLARALLKVAHSPTQPGVYNFSGDGITSWYEFAREIQVQALKAGLLKREIEILPVKSSEYKTAAKRPAWSSLDKTKIKSVFDVDVPEWRSSLQHYLRLEI